MSINDEDRHGTRIVVIGGGTGSFTLLTGLKHYVRYISALVNMADDGGSTGVLRDEYGVLPPGDVRQCLTALSDLGEARNLFGYRFEDGPLAGHSFGNLFLTAAEKLTGSFESGVELASKMLRIHGAVHPITDANVEVRMRTPDGNVHEGEFLISSLHFSPGRPDLWLEPGATITDRSRQAIHEADLVVIAQGHLYGSIAPALVVDGVSEAILESSAKTVYVCNLMTKAGQTDGFTPIDFADEIERFAGAPILNYVLYNTNLPSEEILYRYAADGDHPVRASGDMNVRLWTPIGADLLSRDVVEPVPGDPISASRSLLRHDPYAVARALMKVYYS